ncbi:hypothetical protein EYC84_010785 [Monilinia fructicola]|uniref:Uncharacterized protein n=1 Tax=Monilinia fructicola TaxID=38448 RepID=A0A5M9J6A1_MONFR|nr:hypothetical protein EYC84_010785 [Monilinia fructicola]
MYEMILYSTHSNQYPPHGSRRGWINQPTNQSINQPINHHLNRIISSSPPFLITLGAHRGGRSRMGVWAYRHSQLCFIDSFIYGRGMKRPTAGFKRRESGGKDGELLELLSERILHGGGGLKDAPGINIMTLRQIWAFFISKMDHDGWLKDAHMVWGSKRVDRWLEMLLARMKSLGYGHGDGNGGCYKRNFQSPKVGDVMLQVKQASSSLSILTWLHACGDEYLWIDTLPSSSLPQSSISEGGVHEVPSNSSVFRV